MEGSKSYGVWFHTEKYPRALHGTLDHPFPTIIGFANAIIETNIDKENSSSVQRLNEFWSTS